MFFSKLTSSRSASISKVPHHLLWTKFTVKPLKRPKNGFDYDLHIFNTGSGYHKPSDVRQASYRIEWLSLPHLAQSNVENGTYPALGPSRKDQFNAISDCSDRTIFFIAQTTVLVKFDWSNRYMPSISTIGLNNTNCALIFIHTFGSAFCTIL